MIDINVMNVITIALIAIAAIWIFKFGIAYTVGRKAA